MNASAAASAKSRFRVFTVHDPSKSFTEQPAPPDIREIPIEIFATNTKTTPHRKLTKDLSAPGGGVATFGMGKQSILEEDYVEAAELAIEQEVEYRARSESNKSRPKSLTSNGGVPSTTGEMTNAQSSFLTIDSREVPPLAHNYQLTDDRAKHMQNMPPRPSLADLQQGFFDSAFSTKHGGGPTATIDRNGSAVRFYVSGNSSGAKSDRSDIDDTPDTEKNGRKNKGKHNGGEAGEKKPKKPYKDIFEPHDDEDDEIAEYKKRSARNGSNCSDPSSLSFTANNKLGWVQGVFIRCLLNIFGVMLFVRLSWIVGQAGVGLSCCIVIFSTIITSLTALSMSAICTNGVVRGGGAYYMISRSLGAAFGGPIGVVLSVANVVSVAMHTVGFAETLNDLLEEYQPFYLTASRMNNVRIISASIVTLLLLVALSGTKWESRVQIFLLVTLVLALLNFASGTVLPPGQVDYAKGFVGVGLRPLMDNWSPRFEGGYSLVSIFAIFFPAATGLLAGSNISSELRDPGNAIPKGTIMAIAVSSVTYLVCIVLFGSSVTRDAPGPIIDDPHLNASVLLMPQNWYPSCDGFPSCRYGLSHDFRAMEMVATYAPLVFVGIAAAALSSALTAIVSAPHVFQALCQDNLFPGFSFFGHGSGKSDKPVRAFLLVYVASICFVMIGDLNLIAPVISTIFLVVYATINYACFDVSWSKSPGFRPSFRFYSKWASLVGFGLCLAAMFCVSQWGALASMGAFCALWLYVRRVARPDVHWGSSMEANTYRGCLNEVYKLNKIDEHTKNYRPQVLVLSGYPANRPALVDIVSSFAGTNSLLICGHVLLGDYSLTVRRQITWQAQQWLAKRKVKAFYSQLTSPTFELGARGLMEACGIGKLRPNILFLGFCDKWKTLSAGKLSEYTRVLQHGFDCNMGVALVKLNGGGGLNLHHQAFDNEPPSFRMKKFNTCCSAKKGGVEDGKQKVAKKESINCDNITFVDDEGSTPYSAAKKQQTGTKLIGPSAVAPGVITHAEYAWLERLKMADKFHRKSIMQSSVRRSKEVHVWWLVDDGGLTVFLPHLLAKVWRCKLKVFYLVKRPTAESSTCTADATSDDDFDVSEVKKKIGKTSKSAAAVAADNDANLKLLMKKLRINVRETVPVHVEKPSFDESCAMIARVREQTAAVEAVDAEMASEEDEISDTQLPPLLTDEDWTLNSERIIRQLCIGQQIRQQSKNAAVVFVSMPMPYMKMKPALYMTLLDCLSGEYDVADCFGKKRNVESGDESIGLLAKQGKTIKVLAAGASSSSSSEAQSDNNSDKTEADAGKIATTDAHHKQPPPVILLRGNQQQVLTMYL